MKKCWRHLFSTEVISFFVKRKCQKSEKSVQIVNIKGENLHIFWTNWVNIMKLSGKTWLMIILRVTKKQGFTLFLEKTFLEKPQELEVVKLTPTTHNPSSLSRVKDLIALLNIWQVNLTKVKSFYAWKPENYFLRKIRVDKLKGKEIT